MKVLVTGHRGYIGAHLVKLLKELGHFVTGVDLNLFDGCNWDELPKADIELIKDFRDLTDDEIKEHDCIMHLAAISNDPMGNLNENLTYKVNLFGSIELAIKAKKNGVPKFLFSSSCSVYGKGLKLDLDESSDLNPVSAYAISKVKAEEEISKLADNNFCPVFLRNATAYGDSPMLRIDLVVNNLLACAVAFGNIRIMSDGSPWRPLIHAKDIARAFIAIAEAPKNVIFNQVINIGANNENYQVKEIASYVKELVPNAEIIFTGEVGNDPRNYRVNFDKLYNLLPEFKLEYNLKKGMEELYDKLITKGFSISDFESVKFVRLRTLKNKLHLLK